MVQGFCPLKIKITQFPGGFRLQTKLNAKAKGRLIRGANISVNNISLP